MISEVLDTLATAIEAARLSWGAWAFDGSSEDRRCTIYPADADQQRSPNLMVGLDCLTSFGSVGFFNDFSGHQRSGSSTVRNFNPLTGTFDYEPPLEYLTRTVNVHLFMRETRDDEDREGFDLPTSYARNESRILNALGTDRRQWTAPVPVPSTDPVEFIPRGFLTRMDGSFFVPEDGLSTHGVLSWLVRYPLTDGVELQPGFTAKRIIVGAGLGGNALPGIPAQGSSGTLDLPAGGFTLILE